MKEYEEILLFITWFNTNIKMLKKKLLKTAVLQFSRNKHIGKIRSLN